MNRQTPRIVFNRASGCLVAVAESACSDARPASGERPGRRPAGLPALLLALGLAAAMAGPAWPQTVATRIVPDPHAAARLRPTVIYAPNGVVQVDIQTPNRAGVSHNRYGRFDVSDRGVIVNNSRKPVPSRLGGWIHGNPWLAAGPARVILNEVDSTDPSRLHGPVEIAGSRAEFVLANPAGIQVNGGHFIQATRLTLATGTPVFRGDALQAYRVRDGHIAIDGAGLDARGADYAAILARSAQLNAGVWAQQVHVVTGANEVEAASLAPDGAPQARPVGGEGSAPSFALDVSQLGGMYAGKITLVGTEAGVGVRNAGLVQATAGALTLSHEGWLSHSGALQATGNLTLRSAGAVDSSGLIYSGATLVVSSGATQTHSGTTAARGDVVLTAQGPGPAQVRSTASALVAAGMQDDGRLQAHGDLTVRASGGALLSGSTVAPQDLQVDGASVDLGGGRVSARTAVLQAHGGTLHARGADIQVEQTLALHTPGELVTDDASVQAGRLEIQARALSNRRGLLAQGGGSELRIDLPGELDNREGSITAQADHLRVQAGRFDNTEGVVSHAGSGTLAITATALDNTHGQITGNGKADIALAACLVNQDGLISATGLTVQAARLDNRGGRIDQTGDGDRPASIQLSGLLDNSGGRLVANADTLTVQARRIDNTDGLIGHGAAGALSLAAGAIDNTRGEVVAKGTSRLDAGRFSNREGLVHASQDLVVVAGEVDNVRGSLTATGAASVHADGAFDNGQGLVAAVRDLGVRASQVANAGGVFSSAADVDVTATLAGLDNRDGRVHAGANLTLTLPGPLANAGGRISAAGGQAQLTTGVLDNAGGLVSAGAGLSIDTRGQALSNRGTRSDDPQAPLGLVAGGELQARVGSLDNQAGLVHAQGLTVHAGSSVDNCAGLIYSGSDAQLTSEAGMDNSGGQVLALGRMDAHTPRLDNTQGLVRAGQALALGAADLVNANTQGAQQGIEGQAVRISGDRIDNSQGAVRAAQGLEVLAKDHLANVDGVLSAGGTLRLAQEQAATPTIRIDNTRGLVVGDGGVQIQAASLANAQGRVVSSANLGVGLQGDHTTAGTLQAGSDLSLATTGALVNAAALHAGHNLDATAASMDTTSEGRFVGGASTRLRASGAVVNRGLVDGHHTRIEAARVDNAGTGRIYGHRVGLQAQVLDNRTEDGAAATIAARERLDAGVQTLRNGEGALIYSAGEMVVAGGLDASGQAVGRAQAVDNHGGTIEAAQGLTIAAREVRNRNADFETELRPVGGPQALSEFQHSLGGDFAPDDLTTRFAEAQVTVSPCESLCLTSPAGLSDAFIRYDLTRSTEQTAIVRTAPGRILSGQAMTLAADTVLNEQSQIVAGGGLDTGRAAVRNDGGAGQRIVTDAGTATRHWRIKASGKDRWGSESTAYGPVQSVTPIANLGAARLEGRAAYTAVGSRPGDGAAGKVPVTAGGLQPARPVPAIVEVPAVPTVPAVAGSFDRPAGLPVQPPALGGHSATSAKPTPPARVRTVAQTIRMPTASLFRQHPEPDARYLVETDPQFTQHARWQGSDHLLGALDLDRTHKRLGDAFYEQQLVREQVLALTGHRFLGDFSSDEDQYLALMESGLTFARAHQLRPGIALTPEQMALVTSDMVWLVAQDVTGPDGSVQSVLVPQVYVRVREGDLDGSGTVLAGGEVRMDTRGDVSNTGTVAGRRLVQVTAGNIRNLGGAIDAQAVALKAEQDIVNLGGTLAADRLLHLDAGRDLRVGTTTAGTGSGDFRRAGVARVASLHVREDAGVLLAEAGRDITLTAGSVHSAGDAHLRAGRDVKLDTITISHEQRLAWDARNQRSDNSRQELGTRLSADGHLSISAGRDIEATAGGVSAGQKLVIDTARDVKLNAGQASEEHEIATFTSGRSGGGNKITHTQRAGGSTTTALGTSLEGEVVVVRAGRDVSVQGSSIVADQDVFIDGKRDVTLEAARNTASRHDYRKDTHQGLSSSGLSVTYGKREQSIDQDMGSATASASTVGSIGGQVTIRAGQAYTQTGSDVIAPGGDVDITARTVRIQDGREHHVQDSEQHLRQSGITLAITTPVAGSLQMAQQQLKAAGQTQSGRMQALGMASAAFNARQAVDAVQAGQAVKGGNAAEKSGGIGISLSVGASSSTSRSSSSAGRARGSKVNAGGDVRIRATGGGEDSDLTIRGSDIQAGGTTAMRADHQVSLMATADTTTDSNASRSKNGSVGVGVQLGKGGGIGVTASASRSNGQGEGSSTTHRNTHIEGRRVIVESGGDTTLSGAAITADQVTADVGGDLVVQSLQDTSTYAEKSSQAGGSLMVGAGVGGSVSAGRSRIDSRFRSVGEQSAIRAGDGGFDIRVQGQTQLVGGQVTSTEEAVRQGRNRFDSAGGIGLADVQNAASYSAGSVGVGLGAGNAKPGGSVTAGMSGVGVGSDKGSSQSTTTAGITEVAGDTGARTGDQPTGLNPIFDKEAVRTEIAAQVTITREFAAQTSRAIKNRAEGQRKALQERIKSAQTEQERQQVRQEIHDIDMQERALNILVGAVTGTAGTTVTREALSAAAERMRELMVEDSRTFPGVVDVTGQVITNLSGPSEGQGGDGAKLGGTRMDLDLLCGPANERCAAQLTADGVAILGEDGKPKLMLDEGGRIVFTAKGKEGRRLSVEEFTRTSEGREMVGLTGGVQGIKGTFFGVPYEAGSWQDKLVESFAGPHDYIGGRASGLYDEQGNIKQGMSPRTRAAYDNVVTTGAVPVAAPFALADSVPPETWKAIITILQAVK